MEVVDKVMIDGILEVIEAIMANSMTTQVEIVIGHEVHLADHIVINLHCVEPVRIENLSKMILIKKMRLLQVCRYGIVYIDIYANLYNKIYKKIIQYINTKLFTLYISKTNFYYIYVTLVYI